MPLYVGGQRIARLYKGGVPIARAYRGSTLVFDAAGVSDPGGDPDNVLLVSFDGENGATSATDDSPSNHTLTFNNGARLDSAQAKFGPTSARFFRSSDSYIEIADSDDWHLSGANSDEFTIEFWVRWLTIVSSTTYFLMGQYKTSTDDRSWRIWVTNGAGTFWRVRFAFSRDGTSGTLTEILSGFNPFSGTIKSFHDGGTCHAPPPSQGELPWQWLEKFREDPLQHDLRSAVNQAEAVSEARSAAALGLSSKNDPFIRGLIRINVSSDG